MKLIEHIRPHSIEADLICDHPDGQLLITSPTSQEILFHFSSTKLFRRFLEMVGTEQVSPSRIKELQQALTKATISLRIEIDGKESLKIVPNESPKVVYRKLIPQYLLYKLGL